MANDDNTVGTWVLGLIAVGGASVLLLAGSYFARVVGELSAAASDIQVQLGLFKAVAGGSTQGGSAIAVRSDTCSTRNDESASVEVLRGELVAIGKAVAELKTAVKESESGRGRRQMRAATFPEFKAFPRPSEPILGGDPAKLEKWRAEASDETRQFVDQVMRKHSDHARERLQTETDPMRPDPQVLMRIMVQTQTDIADELSSALPQEDLDALFPAGAGPAGQVSVLPAELEERVRN